VLKIPIFCLLIFSKLVFNPHFFVVGRKFSDKKIFQHFSDRQKSRVVNLLLFCPFLPATTPLSKKICTLLEKKKIACAAKAITTVDLRQHQQVI